MFRGLTEGTLDPKGRLAIPAKQRDGLAGQSSNMLVVTIDTEHRCLLLYPLAEWEKIEQKLQALPSFDPASRRIQRLLIGHATEMELDRAGRILIPSLLREYAALDKQVMLVGQGNKIEIWGEVQWKIGREAWLAEVSGGKERMPQELQTLSL